MSMEQQYLERLNRYLIAMRNEKPDRIPIRPFAAEFSAKYAGVTCQEVTHDFQKAFAAIRKCAADFDWDATVANMVYVWTGLTEAITLRYYAVPGMDLEPDVGFQYLEPPEDEAFMRADEYDVLIDDPTGFLFKKWLPRVTRDIVAPGESATYRNQLALVKGSMAMLHYFSAFGEQNARMRRESGTVSALAGIFKAPFDILADKLRGYMGLTIDMAEQPAKVLKACEALMPHLFHVALTSADPNRQVPIGFWMHRGCVPFITPDQFKSHYWPTLKPIIEELWKRGHQVLFYAEGDWGYHLEDFAELPDASIIYHVDNGDIFKTHKTIGHKFCLSGGIPNYLLSYGTPEKVREQCKRVIDGVARDGGYIMDASAIMQNDTRIENVRAMTDFTREYGVYSGSASPPPAAESDIPTPADGRDRSGPPPYGMGERLNSSRVPAGICLPWKEKSKDLPPLAGDPEIVRRQWEMIEGFANAYIWQILLSF